MNKFKSQGDIQEQEKMRPLIKWAGGKTTEIKHIENMIPTFNRYIEPFFGGGALFFNLEPKNAIINDISSELMSLYKLVKNDNKDKFKTELFNYVHYWERIDTYMQHFKKDFINLYNQFKHNKIDNSAFIFEIERLFDEKIVPFNGLFTKDFCIDRNNLLIQIQSNVIAKLKRVKETIDKNNRFSNSEIEKNIETAFRSGFYMHFRDIMNRAKTNKIKLPIEKKIANYYFIREFCYGGMFRFNGNGEFNVPYGGNAYNKKDFRKKVEYILSDRVSRAFKDVKIANIDFEELLKSSNLSEDDFIFLDPPYDTEFSEYEDNPFTRTDQERLAKLLLDTKAKFILIIKETPFILSLYNNHKNIHIDTFDKEYRFNIIDRMERNVKHLLIHNLNIKEKQTKLT